MRYPWAVPGAKVVCVDTMPIKGPGFVAVPNMIIEGNIYTISEVVVDRFDLCIKLVEVRRGIERDSHFPFFTWDPPYYACRFRPLHTQESDVALFAPLLVLTPAPNAPMLPTNTNLEPTGT